jgi:hypothetical protein
MANLMTSISRRISSILLPIIILSIFIGPQIALPSQCIAQASEKNFERSHYVFAAMVLSSKLKGRIRTEVDDANETGLASDHETEIRFDPIEDFKGNSADLPFIKSVAREMSYGLVVWPGDIWIFHVSENGYAYFCGGSQNYTQIGLTPEIMSRFRTAGQQSQP